jgi:aminopeptidase-like protein
VSVDSRWADTLGKFPTNFIMSYVQLTEAQLYDLGSRGSKYDDRHIIMLHILHLRHEHNMNVRDIAKRMGMKMKMVQKYLNAKVDKRGEFNLD